MGRYITADDLYSEFGKTNVRSWADVENRGNVNIDATIEDVIAEAEAEFEDRLRGGPYFLPLVSVSPTVKRIVKGLAVKKLYFARGLREEDARASQLQTRVDEAEDLMLRVLMGSIRLNTETTWPMPTSPVIVCDGQRHR